MSDPPRANLKEWLVLAGAAAGILAGVVAIPAMVAFALGFPTPVVVAAVSASLGLNLFLLWRLRMANHDRSSLLSHFELMSAQLPGALASVLEAHHIVNQFGRNVGAPATAVTGPPPASSPWIRDPQDLATLALSRADFEECQQGALEIARTLVGADAEARLDYVLLHHDSKSPIPLTPWVEISVVSRSSMKRTSVRFHGAPEAFEVSTHPITAKQLEAERRLTLVTPWVTDASWKDLVNASWLRERPFTGSVVLTAVPSRLTGYDCLWRIAYNPAGSDPVRLMTLRRGELVVV